MGDLWASLFPTTLMFVVMVLTTVADGTMRAFAGFGGGLLLAPVFSLYLSPQDVVVVVVLLNFASTFQLLPGMWKDVDWPLNWRMLPSALIGIPLGGLLFAGLDPSLLRRLVALVVILLSIVLLTGWYYKGPRGRVQDGVAGITSGILTSIAGIGGPPFVLYMLSAKGFFTGRFQNIFHCIFCFHSSGGSNDVATQRRHAAYTVRLCRCLTAPLSTCHGTRCLPFYQSITKPGRSNQTDLPVVSSGCGCDHLRAVEHDCFNSLIQYGHV